MCENNILAERERERERERESERERKTERGRGWGLDAISDRFVFLCFSLMIV